MKNESATKKHHAFQEELSLLLQKYGATLSVGVEVTDFAPREVIIIEFKKSKIRYECDYLILK